MQIVLLVILSCACSTAAVWGTQRFLSERRSRRANGLLAGIGILNALLFSVLTECVIRAGRPLFYYHTRKAGLTTVKLFGISSLLSAVIFALVLMLAERKKQPETAARWLLRSFLLAVSAAVLLEIGFFNFRHFELIGAGAPEMNFQADSLAGRGFYFNRSSWKFHPYSWRSDYQLVTYINYRKVRNITYAFDDGLPETNVRIGFSDQAHRGLEWLDRRFIQGIPRSFSVPLHTVGTTYSIVLEVPDVKELKDLSSYSILLPQVTINQRVPLSVDPVRFALCFLTVFLISAFFPGSPLWETALDFGSWPQMAAVCALLLSVFGWFIWTDFSSYTGSGLPIREQKAALTENYRQYDLLVDALTFPRYALTEIPHRYLEQLDDPYDMRQREGKQFDYLWDTAYYQGNYYVYFGVIPAIAVLLPYRLLTGAYLDLDYPILGFCMLTSIGMYGIYAWFVKRYFRKISFGLYFSGLLLLITPLNLTWCLRRTLVYELAITSGVCFAVWGILFILTAWDSGRKSPVCFLLSGICSALAVGCRPTMLFVSVPVFIAAFCALKASGSLFARRNLRDTALFLLPYILIGLALMKYNYERFDDPFEFGITYQLTTENRAVGIPLLGPYGRLLSILSSLFTFPSADMNFPFIHLQKPDLAYNGVILNSDTVLGVFARPPMLFIPALPLLRKRLRGKGAFLWRFCCGCLAAAAAICVTASAFAVTNRYLTDMLFLTALPAVFAVFCFAEKCGEAGWPKLAQSVVLVCGIFAVMLVITLSLTGEDNWFRQINPLYYDRLRYAFSPWL